MNKTILITGASGRIGTSLLCNFRAGHPDIRVIAVSSKYGRLTETAENYFTVSNDEFLDAESLPDVDVAINCAFARSFDARAITESLDFNARVFRKLCSQRAGTIINISSQGVYGFSEKRGSLIPETGLISPGDNYGIGKYASELILNSTCNDRTTGALNIRCASVCENARFIGTFVRQAIKRQPITVLGGEQIVSLIDIRDVTEALVTISLSDLSGIGGAFNLGTGIQHSISEIAGIVSKKATEFNLPETEIIILPSDKPQPVTGIDPEKIFGVFGWKAKYSLDDMIGKMFEEALHNA